MKFFSGVPDKTVKKQTAASKTFREKMKKDYASGISKEQIQAKLAPQAGYKEKYDEKVNDYIEQFTKIRNRNAHFSGPGSEPKELSEKMKQMMKIMAMRDMMKEKKLEKKKKYELERENKRKQNAATAVATAAAALKEQEEQKARELAAEQSSFSPSSAKGYFFGYTEE